LIAPREALARVHAAALAAVRGDELLRRYARTDGDTWRCELPGRPAFTFALPARGTGGRVVVVGAGKAAAALASGLEASLGERLDGGIVVVKYGHGLPLRRIRVREGAHPVPDAAGEAATREIVAQLCGLGPADCVFVVLSGGASALLVAPIDGLGLDDKAGVHAQLVRSGAAIAEINAVRRALSSVKGGRLAALAGRARLCTLAISDVEGDDPATIGSGPTVPCAPGSAAALAILRRHALLEAIPAAARAILERQAAREAAPRADAAVEAPAYLLLASNAVAQDAAARCAAELGFEVRRFDRPLHGETRVEARAFVAELRRIAAEPRAQSGAGSGPRSGAAPPLLVGGGETTLRVAGTGRGGRCQEFALEAARALDGADFDWTLLAAGSDGTDGPTDAAGAFADGSTLSRGERAGMHAPAVQARNDCYDYFDRLGDLLRTGPTGTNVMDLFYAMPG
jgi:glycerate-2-kinase